MSDAREQFRNAQAIPSDDPMREVECWNHLGLNALRLEDSAEAIAAFSEIKDASAPAKYQLAKLYARSGDLERAVPMLEELRKQIGIANEPYMFRARLEQARGNAKLGGLYRSAAQRAPAQLVNSAHARFYARPLRGRFGAARLMAEAQEVFRGGKREAALELAYRARNADWTRETNLRIVWFAAELKRFDEALKALEAQLEREGRLPLLLQRRAELLELAGRPEDALADWRDVDRLRPSRVAHLALARACERRGDEDGARRHGARALFRDGLTHFRSNSLTLAKTSFMAATERDPKHADSWFYLGEIGRVTRRSNAARAAYARCLDLDPGHSGARAGLAQVNGR